VCGGCSWCVLGWRLWRDGRITVGRQRQGMEPGRPTLFFDLPAPLTNRIYLYLHQLRHLLCSTSPRKYLPFNRPCSYSFMYHILKFLSISGARKRDNHPRYAVFLYTLDVPRPSTRSDLNSRYCDLTRSIYFRHYSSHFRAAPTSRSQQNLSNLPQWRNSRKLPHRGKSYVFLV